MNTAQKEYQNQQRKIVGQLNRILNDDEKYNFGLAGHIIKKFGYQFSIEILERLPEGKPVSYIIGTLKKEDEKSCNHATSQIHGLAETWRNK